MEIKSSWPRFEKDEVEAAKKVLESGKINYWTGENGKSFENEFSSWCGTKRSIALANGSLALSAAYKAIGLKKDDEVITTPRSFVATALEAYLKGARPVFADVDINSGNITAKTIEIEFLTSDVSGNPLKAKPQIKIFVFFFFLNLFKIFVILFN